MRAIIALLLALSPSLAEACQRCGHYGASCYYYKPVATYYPAASNNVYVVQNNAPPLIGQGNTIFRSTGFQSSVYPFFDRNAYLAGVNEIHKGFTAGLAQSMTRADTLAQNFAASDGPVAQVTANADAYERTLNALGLNLNAQSQGPQSNAVVINRDAAGRVQIFKLDQQQIASINNRTGPQGSYGLPQQSQYPMLTQFCARCHGLDKGQPDGNLYLGDHETAAAAMQAKFYRIVKLVRNGSMPKDGPRPNEQQQAALFNEVEAIIEKYGGQGVPQQRFNSPPPPPEPQQGT